ERGAPLILIGQADTPTPGDYPYRYIPGPAAGEHQLFDLETPTGAYRDLELALLGAHQFENAAAALAAVEVLRGCGLLVTEEAIRRGLREVRWPARLQIVGREPLMIVDGAHNAASFAKLFTALRRHFTFARLLLIFGPLADKDLPGMADEIAHAGVARVYATAVAHPRATPPAEIAAALHSVAPALEVVVTGETRAALSVALTDADPHDLICAAGPLYLGGEALRWLAARPEAVAGAIEIAGVDH